MQRAPMPASVRVGCHSYAVLRKPATAMPKEEDGRRCSGLCVFESAQIWIKRGAPRSKAQETLWHEIKHACCYPDFIGVRKSDEEVIDRVAAVELGVLQDNPDLVAYLTT
jgi:hypothetical protein